MTSTRLVLFAHGSKDPRWRTAFEKLEADLNGGLEENGVRLAYMEFAPPTLMEVAADLRASGASRIRLLPLFLAGGAHVARDIPEQVAEVKSRHPELEIEVLAPIGEDPRFGSLLRTIARENA